MAHKIKFIDLYRVHTTAPKRRTKTMLIELPKTTQNSPETPQNTNNLSQKYNHNSIHVSRSILTSNNVAANQIDTKYSTENTKLL